VTAENVINDNASIDLAGGKLALNGAFNESVGALTLSANSVIDFSGFTGTLRFGSLANLAGATLSIWNWSGRTQYNTDYGTYPNSSNLVFTNNATVSSNLANISFYSGSGTGFIGNGFEVTTFSDSFGSGSLIIAVPEPQTHLYAALLILGYAIHEIRRRRRSTESPAGLPLSDP